MLPPIPFRAGQVIVNILDGPPFIATSDPERCAESVWCYGYLPASAFRLATASDMATAYERLARDADVLDGRLVALNRCLRAMGGGGE